MAETQRDECTDKVTLMEQTPGSTSFSAPGRYRLQSGVREHDSPMTVIIPAELYLCRALD